MSARGGLGPLVGDRGEFGADHKGWAVGESILLVLTAVALVLVILRGRR